MRSGAVSLATIVGGWVQQVGKADDGSNGTGPVVGRGNVRHAAWKRVWVGHGVRGI